MTDIKANVKAFAEIPVLIIDDESDLASVNTVDPEKVRAAKMEGKQIRERRAINEQIASMLELMPRAQYVGYTATPFANVFVDPSDAQGIFPKDFVIGLARPTGYMGVEDFHDVVPVDEPCTPYTSNEAAFVRDLNASDDDDTQQDLELRQAIDTFVITGAVKLHRESVDKSLAFRHHTMLVHQSVRKAEHKELSDRIRDLWKTAEFASPNGKQRLRALYERDIVPVSTVRAAASVPAMPSFTEFEPFVARAIARITEHSNNPVIVVNSDSDVQENQQTLDFDRHGTWRILVGGAKLSRGFTVEGLTVTYFRRATNMSDSLTQMGRWFGFRQGYADLVRLFIARQANFGSKTVDLLEAFKSVALDETAFRSQLEVYAEWEGDKPRVKPIEIPPLVSQHLPWLQPTSRNKMFNAVLAEQSEQPFTPSGYANHVDALKRNLDLWRPVLSAADEPVVLPEHGGATFEALTAVVSADDLIRIVGEMEYLYLYGDRVVNPKITWYRRLITSGMLDDFLVIVPQPASTQVDVPGVGPLSIVARDRRGGRGGKFGEITDPKHRSPAVSFVMGKPPDALKTRYNARRGAVLLYLAQESKADYDATPIPGISENDPEYGLVAAFSAYVPGEAIRTHPTVIQFKVRDPSNAEAPTVDATEGEATP